MKDISGMLCISIRTWLYVGWLHTVAVQCGEMPQQQSLAGGSQHSTYFLATRSGMRARFLLFHFNYTLESSNGS